MQERVVTERQISRKHKGGTPAKRLAKAIRIFAPVAAVLLLPALLTWSGGTSAEAATTHRVTITGWFDLDGDAQRDDTEPKLSNRTFLYSANGPNFSQETGSRPSDLTTFDLPPGEYTIKMFPWWRPIACPGDPCTGLPADPSGAARSNRFTFDDPMKPLDGASITLAVDRDIDLDLGIAYSGPTTTIRGQVVNDRDRNAFIGSGDSGLANVAVTFRSPFTTSSSASGSDGHYAVTTVGASFPFVYNTSIAFATPSGFTAAPYGAQGALASSARPSSVFDGAPGEVHAPLTEHTPVDSVNALFADGPYDHMTVSGTIWIDSNRNSVRDVGEQTGLLSGPNDLWMYGWEAFVQTTRLQLIGSDGTIYWDQEGHFPGGHYQMSAPIPCECFVRLTNTGGSTKSIAPTGQGADVSRDNDFIERYSWSIQEKTLIAETSPQLLPLGTVFDLGVVLPPSWSDPVYAGSVWLDDNANGVRDPGEAPAPNVRVAVRVLNEVIDGYDRKPVIATDTTDASGAFEMRTSGGANGVWVAIDPSSIPSGRVLSPRTTAPDGGDPANYSAIEPSWNETLPLVHQTNVVIGIGLAPA